LELQNDRFVRCFWEVSDFGVVRDGKPVSGRWFWYAKGGRYQKWAGLEWLVVDWERNGEAIKEFVVTLPGTTHWSRRVANESYYFRPGLTYSVLARGSMGVRVGDNAIFDVMSMFIFPLNRSNERDLIPALTAVLSNRPVSWLLRVTTQDLKFHAGYVTNLPLPNRQLDTFNMVGANCITLKRHMVTQDPLERIFKFLSTECLDEKSLVQKWRLPDYETRVVETLLQTSEGLNERLICNRGYLDLSLSSL
jgi:hypothetical protein